MIFVTYLEPILVSAATALYSFSHRLPSDDDDPELRTRCRALLVKLDQVLVSERGRIRLLGTYRVDWTSDGVWLCAIPAVTSICEAVVALTEARVLPELLDGDEVSCRSLIDHMIDTFGGESVYADAVAPLIEYRDGYIDVDDSGGLEDHIVTSASDNTREAASSQEKQEGVDLTTDTAVPTFEVAEARVATYPLDAISLSFVLVFCSGFGINLKIVRHPSASAVTGWAHLMKICYMAMNRWVLNLAIIITESGSIVRAGPVTSQKLVWSWSCTL